MLHMFELNSIRNQKNQQSKTTHQTILPTLMWWKRRLLEYSRVPPSLFQQGFCKCTICFFNVTRASWFTAKSWRTLTTWLKIQNLISWNFGYTVLLRFCTKIKERGNRRLAGGDSAGQQLVNLQRKKPRRHDKHSKTSIQIPDMRCAEPLLRGLMLTTGPHNSAHFIYQVTSSCFLLDALPCIAYLTMLRDQYISILIISVPTHLESLWCGRLCKKSKVPRVMKVPFEVFKDDYFFISIRINSWLSNSSNMSWQGRSLHNLQQSYIQTVRRFGDAILLQLEKMRIKRWNAR